MRKNIWAILVMILVMFGLPWAAVTFAPGDAGMAIAFILFFGLNPAESMFAGIYSGLDMKHRWYLPAVNAALFLLGVWTVFDWGNPDFYGFCVAYLAVALVAMLTTVIVVRTIRKELNQQ